MRKIRSQTQPFQPAGRTKFESLGRDNVTFQMLLHRTFHYLEPLEQQLVLNASPTWRSAVLITHIVIVVIT